MRATIPWGDGTSDNIYLDFAASAGDQQVLVSSDANGGNERTKNITFTASGVNPVVLTVKQEAYVADITIITYNDTAVTWNDTAVGYQND